MIEAGSDPRHAGTAAPTALAALACLALAAAPLRGSVTIEKWDVLELLFEGPRLPEPFTDPRGRLTGTFTSPSGEALAIRGFFDGDGRGGQEGRVWKLRFLACETGRWSYVVRAGWKREPIERGAIDVQPSERPGILVRDPERPTCLRFLDGPYFLECGPNDPEAFLSEAFGPRERRLEEIAYLAERGMNVLYVGLVNAGPGDGGPRAKVVPWMGDPDRPDFDAFDLARMHEWEAVFDRMEALGIAIHLVFYLDDCGGIARRIPRDREDLFFDTIVARFASLRPLIWNLAEEYEEAFSREWAIGRARFLRERDPYGHPITCHQLGSDRFAFAGEEAFDLTAIQYNATDPEALHGAALKLRRQVAEAGRPIPISVIEWTDIRPAMRDAARRGTWALATAGATFQIFGRCAPGEALARWDAIWRDAARLKETLEDLAWYEMEPADDLVDGRGAFCLAKAGERYLVYLARGGEVGLDLGALEGDAAAEWVNPRDGTRSPRMEVRGGGRATFRAPGREDWLLIVTKSR